MFEKKEETTLPAVDGKKAKKTIFGKIGKRKTGRESLSESQKLGIRTVLIPLILALIVTCVIWLVLSQQKDNMDAFETGYIATKEIPAHTKITPDEFDLWFQEALFLKDHLPKKLVQNKNTLPEKGFYTEREITENEMLFTDTIIAADSRMEKYEEGYTLASVSADSFKNCINGSVRRGDIIDIYARNPATAELERVIVDAYVEAAYDNNGNPVTDGQTAATSFTIRVAPEELENLTLAIGYGEIHIFEPK